MKKNLAVQFIHRIAMKESDLYLERSAHHKTVDKILTSEIPLSKLTNFRTSIPKEFEME